MPTIESINLMEMGRLTAFRKRCWTQAEDELLKKYVDKFSEGNWKHIPSKSGLNRCRKSCRLRYMNYLRPNIKRGSFALDEDDLIIRLHRLLGNRWTLIAGRIPGRTANDIKNYWNSYLSKKSSSSLENNNQTYHHHHTSNIYLKPSEGGFESLSTGHEQDGEEEEEQDITSFWKRLLLEVDYLENKMGVDNKEMKTKDDELFQGLEDFSHDIEIEGGSG